MKKYITLFIFPFYLAIHVIESKGICALFSSFTYPMVQLISGARIWINIAQFIKLCKSKSDSFFWLKSLHERNEKSD